MHLRNGMVVTVALLMVPTLTKAYRISPVQGRTSRAEKSSGVPRLYVATGPTSDSDLARLRKAVGKLTGVEKVEARAEFDAITVTIDGDGRSTESLLTAAARSAGYVMRPVRARFYSATGPSGPDDLNRLRLQLGTVPGVEQVALGERPGGAAVRIFGVRESPAIVAVAKSAGFTLRQVGSYVAAGSSSEMDLKRLRDSLGKIAGVERVELQGLSGGATLLIYGDAGDFILSAAAKSAGYALWPLNNASGPNLFKIEAASGVVDTQKLSQNLQKLEGIGKIEILTDRNGQQLSVQSGKVRPAGIIAAARECGVALISCEPPVLLPTLTPESGRSTPPDYDERVLEERANLGAPAPDFTVLSMDGMKRRTLADYLAAKKPVVLIFGSCTCPRFMGACPPLEQLYQIYKDRVTFLLVYIAEAHPGQILSVPNENGEKELRIIPQITTEAVLIENLKRLVRLAKLTIPTAVDNPANSTNNGYAGYPNRLYAIGVDGKVAFKGEPGPTGLKVPDLAEWLRDNIK